MPESLSSTAVEPRVRFAPSPTGFLHVGSARTFIFNWLYARHNRGSMILRLDDTDVERNTQASVDSIFEGLKWLGFGGHGKIGGAGDLAFQPWGARNLAGGK